MTILKNGTPTGFQDRNGKEIKTADRINRRPALPGEMEDDAVQNGCTLDEARRILTIQDFQDEELCDELRDRGYRGEITKTKTIKI